MGASHAANYRALGDRVRVKTVASRRSDRAAAVAESVGAPLTDDLQSVLRDPEVDAVDICLPTDRHAAVTLDALRAGKHVLVEKPMALDGETADRMIAEAARSHRVLMTAQVLRFFPAYEKTAELVKCGKLGAVRSAIFRRRCAAPAWSKWLADPTLSVPHYE